jgi:ABC-type multidrug transport system fused ATPase/permease subunit
VVALVGSTGSGKSTLCTVLSGLVPPEAGTIEVGGVPLPQVAPEARADATALVFQESFLFADTIRANIDLSGRASDDEVERAARIAQVDEFVDQLPDRWDTVVGERGVTLSGGQRQRVALARALIRTPRILLLDDATSAVDPRIEQQILAGLRDGQPVTTVIVAQRVSTIEVADRVLYLAGGRIARAGTHRELMDEPGYRALVEAYEAARQ